MIRANEVMFKAGQTETVILRKLSGADPEGKRHVVRLLRTFEYRQHLCLVFENMVSSQLLLCRVLWAAIDGSSYVWVPVKTRRGIPPPHDPSQQWLPAIPRKSANKQTLAGYAHRLEDMLTTDTCCVSKLPKSLGQGMISVSCGSVDGLTLVFLHA